jgi:hypothetical protein
MISSVEVLSRDIHDESIASSISMNNSTSSQTLITNRTEINVNTNMMISDVRLEPNEKKSRIAFGSCNDQKMKNNLWNVITSRNPAAFIWGGDAIYAGMDSYFVSPHVVVVALSSGYASMSYTLSSSTSYCCNQMFTDRRIGPLSPLAQIQFVPPLLV